MCVQLFMQMFFIYYFFFIFLSNTATTYTAEDDYLIKLLKTMNNEQQADVFRTMHDPNHRHPRHRGKKKILD